MGLLDGLFDKMKAHGPQPRSTEPNVANKIAAHLTAKWPELVGIPGLWFSGSQVHAIVNGKEPPASSDTDIFCLRGVEKVKSFEAGYISAIFTERTVLDEVMYRLKVGKEAVTPRTHPNPMYQSRGYDIKAERGDLDLWTAEADSVHQQLRMYPASHSHCRAAFSFTEGLVVLPNEAAK